MNIFVAIVGVSSGLFSLLGIVAPDTIRDFVGRRKKKNGFWFAIAGRLVVGILFIFAAPQCLLSDFVYVAGLVIATGGGILAIAGPKRFEALLDWWTALSAFEIRTWTFLSALFGGLLVYASGWPSIS
ncbi:MAG: hypothetical protein VCD00_00885 [Candidatus Hydrogenedentota bacterium]